jgi:hypothetical protein
MRTRTPGLVLLALATVLAGGCASKSASTAGSAPAPSPSNTSGCPASLTITATDATKSLCVQVGGSVTVDLQAVAQKPWLAINASGPILVPVPSSAPATSPGSQHAVFTAKSAGSADITSAYRACPSKPGTISCNAIVAWKVTVQVK